MAPIANLTVKLSAQIAEFQAEFREAAKSADKFASEFEGIATRASAVGTFLGNVAEKIASSIASAFGQGLKDAIRLSSEFQNAFLGLSSVANAFGTGADAARTAAQRLSSDGLLPLKDSATGLKNLLATGFSLDQATQLMNAFKDSAAFGRQGALSFGDAIRSATEGVKNGNSILVDNAGITKNLSQILKEAGFSAQDLSRASTDAGVRMALFNGILKESAAFTGDADKLSRTYTGTLTAMQTQWQNLLATWGDAITQNATVAEGLAFVGDLFRRLTGFLKDNGRGFDFVSDAVITFVGILSGAVKAVNFLQQAFNLLDTALMGVVKGITDSVRGLAKVLLDIAVFASKLPGSTLALSVFREELTSLVIVAGETAEGSRKLGERIAENDRRTVRWSQTLESFGGTLDDLKKRLESTRGKTVALGEAGERLGKGFTSGGAEAVKAVKALQKVLDEASIGLRLGVPSTLPGFKVDMKGIMESVLLPALPDLGKIIPLYLAKLPGELAKISIPALPQTMFQKLFGDDFGSRMGQTIMSAIQGGGNILGAAGSLIGSTLTGNLAKTITSGAGLAISGALGTAINAILPGVGALVGPLVDKLFSAFDRNKGRDMVKDFAASMGGFAALQERLNSLGVEGQRLSELGTKIGRNNTEQAKEWIRQVNEALGEQSSRLKNASSVLAEYGLTWEDTGQKFKNAHIAEQFDALHEKTLTLKDIGVDYSTILEKQAGQYSDLVKAALRSGTEIPASMRPILEDLSRMGKLVDSASGEFLNLEDVTWAKTLTQGFDQVTGAINRLTDALTKGVGGALDALSGRRVTVPVGFSFSGGESGGPTFSASSVAAGGTTQNIDINLDGETIARKTVRFFPSELSLNGV